MPEEKKEEKKEAELIEIPTQTALAYKLENGDIIEEKQMLLKIYNDIQKIKKSLG